MNAHHLDSAARASIAALMMVLPARRAHVLGCGLAGSTWQLCDALKKVGAAVEAVLWRGIVDDENRCLRVKCADRAHSQLREVGIVGILDLAWRAATPYHMI